MPQPYLFIWETTPFITDEADAFETYEEFSPNDFSTSCDFKAFWCWVGLGPKGYDLKRVGKKHGFDVFFKGGYSYHFMRDDGAFSDDVEWFTPRQLAEAAAKVLALIDDGHPDGRYLLEGLWSFSYPYRPDETDRMVLDCWREQAKIFRTLMQMFRDCEPEAARFGIKRFTKCSFFNE